MDDGVAKSDTIESSLCPIPEVQYWLIRLYNKSESLINNSLPKSFLSIFGYLPAKFATISGSPSYLILSALNFSNSGTKALVEKLTKGQKKTQKQTIFRK